MKLAQAIPTYTDPSGNAPAQLSDFEAVFGNLLYYVLAFAGVVIFIMFLMGGFKWLTSAGNPKNVESARNTLTYAVVGLLVIVLSYIILVIIRSITGAQVTNFRVTIP
ncbi:hypothetical protein A2115_03835 [Candidatus Woesebacteria bacterium GWA1_41_8]|jgi:hypothetical protein|uniref:Uncharacterized protein n=1 Tax=Candidatus Woesebacteria bacterium GWA1_41_8 TaxID=1802471 RepID=A0A1F7WG87_9BACT|nr:MAG: hypothetical protein A2115_03835 [Candidatus Woesebacteria bacterium GWA1_41_8]